MFSRRVVHRGWVVLAGVVGGGLGLVSELASATLVVPGWLGLSILAASVVVAFFWAFHDYRLERDKEFAEHDKHTEALRAKLKAIEETPKFQLRALLRDCLTLEELLTEHGETADQELRARVAALVTEARMMVNNCAPEYAGNIEVGPLDGSGQKHLLAVVVANYKVLAEVCKRL